MCDRLYDDFECSCISKFVLIQHILITLVSNTGPIVFYSETLNTFVASGLGRWHCLPMWDTKHYWVKESWTLPDINPFTLFLAHLSRRLCGELIG